MKSKGITEPKALSITVGPRESGERKPKAHSTTTTLQEHEDKETEKVIEQETFYIPTPIEVETSTDSHDLVL